MHVRGQDHFTERCLKLLQNNMVFLSDELICIWSSFSKLESSIGCSLKSFPSYLKLDSLVVIIHDVIYIFKLQLLMNIVSFFFFSHFFDIFSKRWKSLILVRRNWFSRMRLLVEIVFELVLYHLILWFKIIDENYISRWKFLKTTLTSLINKVLLVLAINHAMYYCMVFTTF
jgi:hypothetical protein